MSAIEATIKITADWLFKHKPVVFTNRTKDQPLMANRFPIYQHGSRLKGAPSRMPARSPALRVAHTSISSPRARRSPPCSSKRYHHPCRSPAAPRGWLGAPPTRRRRPTTRRATRPLRAGFAAAAGRRPRRTGPGGTRVRRSTVSSALSVWLATRPQIKRLPDLTSPPAARPQLRVSK